VSVLQSKQLVGVCRQHSELVGDTPEVLGTVFAELIENSVKHGRLKYPAWLFANYHPQPEIMHICIADRGVGIQKTFLESDHPELRSLAQSHPTNWIRRATDPLVTSKTSAHAGYGLYIVRELCRQNRGTFVLISGDAYYRLSFKSSSGGSLVPEEYELSLGRGWSGTVLAMNLKVSSTLDLNSIYSELPPPKGFEDEPEIDIF